MRHKFDIAFDCDRGLVFAQVHCDCGSTFGCGEWQPNAPGAVDTAITIAAEGLAGHLAMHGSRCGISKMQPTHILGTEAMQ